MLHVILGTLIGFAVGCTVPGIISKVRGEVSAEGKKVVSLIEGEVAAAEKDIKAKL